MHTSERDWLRLLESITRAAIGWAALPYTSSRVEAFQLLSLDEIEVALGQKSVRENWSFAPSGLDHFPLLPTACAVGCFLRRFAARNHRSCSTANPRIEFSPTYRNRTFLFARRSVFFPSTACRLASVQLRPRPTILGESGKNFIETGKQVERRDAILLEARSVNPALGRLRRNNAEAKTRKK
jgi:hypothetical protein